MKSFGEVWSLASRRNGHYSLDEYTHRELYRVLRDEFKHLDGHRAKPVALELGVCHGRTFVLLAAMGYELYGVDDYSLEGSASELRGWVSENSLEGAIIESSTRNAIWHKEVDVLIVDAGHSEPDVSADISKYLPFLRPGGIVFFDDYADTGLPREQDAHWAIKAYADAATVGWERFPVGRLMAFRKPSE